MDHTQWLEERRKGIGGSDVAAILGLSPFKTAYQIYQEKRKEVVDWSGNKVTDWGKRMEPAIRQWYSDQTGRAVRLPDKIMYHDKYPFLLASLDGFTDDHRIVEIKTARSGKGWGEPGTNEIPDYYAVQCHHYMIVTGFEVTDVPVSVAGGSPELYEVPAILIARITATSAKNGKVARRGVKKSCPYLPEVNFKIDKLLLLRYL